MLINLLEKDRSDTREPSPDERVVHVVEDNQQMREAMLRSWHAQGIAAVGYPTGEALLRAWHAALRGVVSMDIDLKSGGGGLDGDEVFDRLMALDSHLPVVFLTGPYAHHMRLMSNLIRRRGHVDYFGKQEPSEAFEARVLQLLDGEPDLYSQITHWRWVLRWLVVELTHHERLALDGSFRGSTSKEWAQQIDEQTRQAWLREIGKLEAAAGESASNNTKLPKVNYRTLDLQRLSGLNKLPGRLPDLVDIGEARTQAKTVAMIRIVSLVLHAYGVDTLRTLFAKDFARRLNLIGPADLQAIARALARERLDASDAEQVAQVLGWMALDNISELRKLLKTAAFEAHDEVTSYRGPSGQDLVWRWLDWLKGLPLPPKKSGQNKRASEQRQVEGTGTDSAAEADERRVPWEDLPRR